MPYAIDETHDPKLESWVESANDPETDFPIQNLPFVTFDAEDTDGPYVGTVIGNKVVLLYDLWNRGHLRSVAQTDVGPAALAFRPGATMANDICDLTHEQRSVLRRELSRLLSTIATKEERQDVGAVMVEWSSRRSHIPARTNDYTDFYASVYHATNVGSMFRPDNPLLPNYKWIPVGYHGRASSIVPSGTPIVRPHGQQAPAEDGPEARPTFAPCKMLDYELELGVVIGRGNELGRPVSITEAEDHILGLCLLNDWSARDVQKWEYQPLGPFLAKNFATTVSPCIVTMEALAPFRVPAMERPPGDPQPLPHLDSLSNRDAGGFDITLEVHLATKQMRNRGLSPVRLSKGNFRDMYWTVAQMISHHTSNGCNLQPGDLLGSGTISGPTRDSRGCLLELTWDGDPWATPPVVKPTTARTPITLPTGETRRFLEDGDEVIIKGYCQREGFRRIGFGECRGVIEPARR
ncbi:MAG: fumarylacetoacetase [Leptolyngbya sp. PLA3]|nr:MAG: fumarylacetoacetase [Cyanobacteria bacterium CYA]MCE7969676.1 fumarylacetoacetase [Leptolyngbya sp. PL-A3]